MKMNMLTNALNILVVEDDVALNRMFCKHLKANGYVVETSYTVTNALNVLKYGTPPDLVVDLELSDGTSKPIIELLCDPTFERTRVIVVSGHTLEAHYGIPAWRIYQALLKPVSPRGLSLLVNNLFGA